MPVIGTPVLLFTTTPTLSPLITLSPPVTQIYRVPVPAKMRGIAIRQSQQAEIALYLLDYNGNPVDLTDYGFPDSGTDDNYTIVVNIQEPIEATTIDSVSGTVLNPANGYVKFTVPQDVITTAGVFLCEAGALNNSGLILSNQFYLMVQRGLFNTFGGQPSGLGPPTLDEMRIALRDSPESSRLTDEYEYDVSEICDSLVRAVQSFNSAPPPLDCFYDTRTFPARHNWIEGATVYLLELAAMYFRRNTLPYSAGGISVDDLNKTREYEAAIQAKREQWQTWVKMKRVGLNMEAGFSTFGSSYDYF